MTNDDDAALVARAKDLVSKATPGPWHVASDAPTYAIYADGGTRVVQTPNQNNYRKFELSEHWLGIEREADAALIAAAPTLITDLAAALERAQADAARMREALERTEALEKALSLFVAATGEYEDGTVWVEPSRVPFDAFVRARAALEPRP